MANTFDFVPFTGGFTIKLGTDDGIDYPAGFWKVETPAANVLEIRNVFDNSILHRLVVGSDTVKFSGAINAGDATAIKTALQSVFFKAGGTALTTANDIIFTDYTKGVILPVQDGAKVRLTAVRNTDNSITLNLSDPF